MGLQVFGSNGLQVFGSNGLQAQNGGAFAVLGLVLVEGPTRSGHPCRILLR